MTNSCDSQRAFGAHLPVAMNLRAARRRAFLPAWSPAIRAGENQEIAPHVDDQPWGQHACAEPGSIQFDGPLPLDELGQFAPGSAKPSRMRQHMPRTRQGAAGCWRLLDSTDTVVQNQFRSLARVRLGIESNGRACQTRMAPKPRAAFLEDSPA